MEDMNSWAAGWGTLALINAGLAREGRLEMFPQGEGVSFAPDFGELQTEIRKEQATGHQ